MTKEERKIKDLEEENKMLRKQLQEFRNLNSKRIKQKVRRVRS